MLFCTGKKKSENIFDKKEKQGFFYAYLKGILIFFGLM